jgi:hypothetical protein
MKKKTPEPKYDAKAVLAAAKRGDSYKTIREELKVNNHQIWLVRKEAGLLKSQKPKTAIL